MILFITASHFTSITCHIHNQLLFLLWLHLFILSGFTSLLFSNSSQTPTYLGSSSFSVIPFCLSILFMGFSRQEYWSGLSFPSPVDHILSELCTVTCLFWVALHCMAQSFVELDNAVVHVINLFSVIVVFILSTPWWIRIRGLWKPPDGRDWESSLWEGTWVLFWWARPCSVKL